jgi:hypothetical protein
MQIGEAVVSGASQGPKGAQEVEFKAVCSMASCERLNVIAGEWRAAVTLDRPPRGALCQFKVTVPAERWARRARRELRRPAMRQLHRPLAIGIAPMPTSRERIQERLQRSSRPYRLH